MKRDNIIFLVRSRFWSVVSVALILGQLTGCLLGDKDKKQSGGTSRSALRKAVLTSFDMDPHVRAIRPFEQQVWVFSKSKDTHLARLKGDRFVALDNKKLIKKFDASNTNDPAMGLAITDVMVDSKGNTYVVPDRDASSSTPPVINFKSQEVMGMIKAEDMADPENATWAMIKIGASDKELVGGSWVDSIALGLDGDIIVGMVAGGINFGKAQPNSAPVFALGGTRRTADIEYPQKIVVTAFGHGNDYVVFSQTPGAASQRIYAFGKDISGQGRSANWTKALNTVDNFYSSTMAATNGGKAVWLATGHDKYKLGRMVADGNDVAISTDDLTYSSTGLDTSSAVVGFAAIGNITCALLGNGKLYHLDESKLVQDNSGIKNSSSVKFIAIKFKGLASIDEGYDLAATGNTLWILAKDKAYKMKAYRIENADVALDTLKE